MNTLLKAAAVVSLLVAVLAPVRADSSASRSGSNRATAYKIRTTDKLRISIFQEDDLSTICRVDAKGTVNLPLVGEVRIYGQTLDQAEQTIEEAYINGRFLRKPEVTVAVEEYAAREVSIQGQVKSPGRYPLPVESSMSVVDLVTRAGGFTDTAQGTAVRVILPRAPQAAATPEPATTTLLGTGLVAFGGFGLYRRRRGTSRTTPAC